MAERKHRVCNACVKTNEYVARDGAAWNPGFCCVCLKERKFTIPEDDVRDPREGMAVIVWMAFGWVFALAAAVAVWRCL